MRRPLATLATLAFLAVIVGACGDDDSGGDDLKAYQEALSGSIAVDDISEDFAFTDENADCVAGDAVDVIGIDRLEEVGDPDEVAEATSTDLSVFELDQDELDQISASFLDCVDGAEEALRDEFLAGTELEGEQAECVSDLVDRDVLIRILSTGLGGLDPTEALGDLQADFQACV